VALIVLLVPELLTGPIRSAPRAAAATAGGAPLRSITISLDDAARSKSAGPQGAATESPAPVPLPETAPAEEATVTPQADTPAAVPAPAPAAPPAATPPPSPAPVAPRSRAEAVPTHPKAEAPAAATAGSLVVQLGSFASRSNADHFAQKLKGQGFTASVSQYPSGRRLYRVWVGPVHDHGAAVALQGKLQAAGHVGAIVAK
jgi:cell division protein FtsN